jgi:DNA-binding IclR family transcriptional regulator
LTTSFTHLSLSRFLDLFLDLFLELFLAFLLDFALRNLIPHLDNESYFEQRLMSTRTATLAAKRQGKTVATDRSFVMALARGLDVLRAFHPNDGLLGNQEIAARTKLPKPTISRLTYTLTKLGYLTQVPRFEKYQLAPAAMALGYAALANLGVRHLSESFREDVMRETGGAVAVGGRDRLSMIYFGQSRSGLALGVQLDVGSRIPIATTAMGRAYIWALPNDERVALLRALREHYGSRWPRMREGIERSGEMVERYGFTISAGEWQDDVHAAGVALKLNDGTGPYAFNCGAPAFRFTEDRLRNDIGPRLVAMVRNIELALGGAAPKAKNQEIKKTKSGGKVARVVEGIR